MSIRPIPVEEYKRLIEVSLRKHPPTVWFKNVPFVNVYTGEVDRGHIYIYKQHIAYVGEQEPLVAEETEIVELEPGQIVVPGYIEPHSHPFQWYNPLSWGEYVVTQGTTTSINDNMALCKFLPDDRGIEFIDRLHQNGEHLWLWWSRFDNQSHENQANGRFNDETVQKWLSHPLVVQAGELTSWPKLLQGDDDLSRWMVWAKHRYAKRIEGHLPGSSVETLNALAAAGVSADHESLHGQDVVNRLRLGYYVALRYSSIRPDLPAILQDLRKLPSVNLSRILLTNDGSTPFFIEESGCDRMIQLVMEAGFPAVDAYRMTTLNPATYYGLDGEIGGIAPGRLAHLNILPSLEQPTPLHVMVDGKWVVQDGKRVRPPSPTDWLEEFFPPLQPAFSVISLKDQLSVMEETREGEDKVGIALQNDVITRPYTYQPQTALVDDELHLALVNQQGKWLVQTRLKGYASSLIALASSYTALTDFLLMGKNTDLMLKALDEVLGMGGGIVAYFADGTTVHIPLPLLGGMSKEPMDEVKKLSQTYISLMQENGHAYGDPIYTLLFLTATHLPFIRLTNQGLFLIKEQKIIQAARPIPFT